MLHTIPLGIVSSTAAAYLIEQSLLGDGTSSYLNRTPSVAGNRKTWTFSCWFKGTPVSSSFLSVEANDANGPQTDIAFQGGGDANKFEVYGYSSSYDFRLLTSSLYRDSSAWYHIVVAMDTTQATAANRTKIYINGTQVTSFGTSDYPTLNYDTGINALKEHFVMKGPGAGGWVNGAVALPILVDGVASAPTAFGEVTDDGFWDPIEFVPDTVGSNLTANYVTSVSNNGGGGFATSPVTFSSVDIGTASATRKVIVGVGIDGYQGNEAYTSLTIGGVAANLIQEQNAASGGRPVALYELDVSSGTSADIVVTFTGTQTKCYSMGIGVWTIEGGTLFSTVGSTADPGAGNVNVPAGGTVIAIMTEGNAAATYAWANLTENFDNQVRASRQAFSGASKNLSSYTTQAISANVSGGSQFAMLAASFAPAGGIGINGFQLDYEDTAFFGKDSATTSDFISLAAANWEGDTGNWTFSGDDISHNNTSESGLRLSAITFSGDFEVRGTWTVRNHTSVMGVYETAEDGTFGGTGGGSYSGKMASMTNSYWVATIGSSATGPYTGGTQDSTVTNIAAGALVTMKRVGTNIYLYVGPTNALAYTWATGRSNTVRFVIGSNATMDIDNVQYRDGSSLVIGNDYFANNFTTSDQLEDTPTDSADDGIGNYITLVPNLVQTGLVLSEGNTHLTSSGSGIGDGGIKGNIFVSSGVWHWEVTAVNTATNAWTAGITTVASGTGAGADEVDAVGDYAFVINGGQYWFDVNATSGYSSRQSISSPNGRVFGFIYNYDAGTLNVYNAGLSGGVATLTSIPTTSEMTVVLRSSNAAHEFDCNFGQRPFVDGNLNNANAIATQNLPDTHPLYTGTAAQYRAGAQVQSDALGGNSTGNANQSMRVVIPASAIADQSATRVRLKLKAASSQAFDTSHLYFGTNATGGSNAWDFTGDQVQVSVNGSTTISVAAGTSVYSDWFTFACDGTDPLCAAWLFAATGGGTGYAATSGHTRYYKTSSTSSTDASATSPSGFTAQSNYFMLIAAIEVQ